MNYKRIIRVFKVLGIFYTLFGIYCLFFNCEWLFSPQKYENKYIIGIILILLGFSLFKLYSILLKILKDKEDE